MIRQILHINGLKAVFANDDGSLLREDAILCLVKSEAHGMDDPEYYIVPFAWSNGDKEFSEAVDCKNFLGLEFGDDLINVKDWSGDIKNYLSKMQKKP